MPVMEINGIKLSQWYKKQRNPQKFHGIQYNFIVMSSLDN